MGEWPRLPRGLSKLDVGVGPHLAGSIKAVDRAYDYYSHGDFPRSLLTLQRRSATPEFNVSRDARVRSFFCYEKQDASQSRGVFITCLVNKNLALLAVFFNIVEFPIEAA